MNTTTTMTRNLTIDERFFKQPTVVHQPFSLPQDQLPSPAVAPVPPAPKIDLSKKQFQEHSTLSKLGQIMEEYWIVVAILGGVGVCYVAKCFWDSQRQNNMVVYTGSAENKKLPTGSQEPTSATDAKENVAPKLQNPDEPQAPAADK